MSESGSTPTKPVPAPRRGSKPKEPRASNKLKNFKTQFGIGIWFKIGAEGSFGVAARGNGCFLCPTNSLIYQMFVHATPDSHCYLACVKRGDR